MGTREVFSMFKRTRLISVGVIVALMSGIATATAATAHPKKKMTHVSRQVPKSTATPPSTAPAQRPSSNY
jgi:hypothetical protein